MKKLLLLSAAGIFLPAIVFAQQWDIAIPSDGFVYASIFAGNFSLLLSVVIGAIATSLVFRSAERMKGGLFGSVLNYISVGMTLMVLGTMSAIASSWSPSAWFGIAGTVCFAIGYIFMVIAANKLFNGIMNTYK